MPSRQPCSATPAALREANLARAARNARAGAARFRLRHSRFEEVPQGRKSIAARRPGQLSTRHTRSSSVCDPVLPTCVSVVQTVIESQYRGVLGLNRPHDIVSRCFDVRAARGVWTRTTASVQPAEARSQFPRWHRRGPRCQSELSRSGRSTGLRRFDRPDPIQPIADVSSPGRCLPTGTASTAYWGEAGWGRFTVPTT